ncbi:ATP-dependent helicase [Mycoplasmopsis gallinarum]|uniref:DNA 3'-5' helicase n=1 Tax=Mycoplasmopsis gallinarum TaxID=29557 RepID=A0A168RIT3_9BACT|nr:UvrD-helicase domain-containing protein [Mycoplasmopsis gallinarum]OAB49025.1 ATP-dependent DNA helicase UvrD/PcrA [Mycoplasmopsis gallinarum]
MNRKEDILRDLNEDQLEALLYFDGPLRIIAGAGSGKTRVLTRKIAYLINVLGIHPSQILALTFTNKAANEMNERVKQYVGEDSDKAEISTFHSLCAKILRVEAKHLGYKNDFQIIDDSDKKFILSEIYKAHNLSAQELNFRNVITTFSLAKNANLLADELLSKLNDLEPENYQTNVLIVKMFEEYNLMLQKQKYFDFDDLIIQVNNLFNKFPEIATKWSQKYDFILVDEFQDTSKMQYEIVKKLISKNAQITIVGDPDQTIYSWRGADVNLILNFEKDFPNAKTIILNTNYRSTKSILNAANKLIKYNQKRYSKDLVTDNSEGEEIEFIHAFSVEAEARWVVQKINELKKKKIQLKNIAIFYRSNYYSRSFEEELIKENINYKILNGQKFFDRKEIKDVLAFLRVIYDSSDISLLRIINTPARKIGEVTLNKIKAKAVEEDLTIYKTLIKFVKELDITYEAKKNIVDFLNSINKHRHLILKGKHPFTIVLKHFLKEVGYFDYLNNDPALKRTGEENVQELIRSMETWETQNRNKNLADYLAEISLYSAGDEYDNGTNYVTLMTVHSAKGLEFDNVFLVGMSEQIFPHYKVLLSDDENSLEEERRLAYVAITRAKDRLFISDSRGALNINQKEKKPSRFIKEMGIDLNKFILQTGSINLDLLGETDDEKIKEINKKIIPGDIISHTMYGEGTVLEVNQDNIRVKFVTSGSEKTLSKNHPSIRLLKNIN